MGKGDIMKKIILGIHLLVVIFILNGCNANSGIESINLNKRNNTIRIKSAQKGST